MCIFDSMASLIDAYYIVEAQLRQISSGLDLKRWNLGLFTRATLCIERSLRQQRICLSVRPSVTAGIVSSIDFHAAV